MKFVFKAWLAFGDCALLLLGGYDRSYAVKKLRIEKLAHSDLPEPAFLLEGYQRAVAFKEWGDCTAVNRFDLAREYERTRRYYVRFFYWHESRRLGREVGTTAAYARALAQAPRDCPRWKALLLNGQSLGLSALSCGAELLWAHPRARLYLALPLLLGEEPIALAEVSGMLAAPCPDIETAEQRFYHLQRRFS